MRISNYRQWYGIILSILIFITLTTPIFATAPTVNGQFYGDGDDGRYNEISAAPNGRGTLYQYLDGTTLYVAVVVDASVNDNVFGDKSIADDQSYVGSVNWNHHSSKDLINSDKMQFKLTCGSSIWEWAQDYVYDSDGDSDPAEADWLSGIDGKDGSIISGGTPPIIASASSMQWNMNNTTWDVTLGGTRTANDLWKSPYTDPASLAAPNNLGYPDWDGSNNWEWAMVYEMSIDLSSWLGQSVTIEVVTAHNSPSQDGNSDLPIPPATLIDFGDAPDPK